jgi:hypothetical protein
MNSVKYAGCPANPSSSNILPISSVLKLYLESPEMAVKMWRSNNFSRFNVIEVRAKYPTIVLDKILEMVEYFKSNGINSTHLIYEHEKVVDKYSRTRMTITDCKGKVIATEVSCAPKYPKALNGRELAYNRKSNANTNLKQYNYKQR